MDFQNLILQIAELEEQNRKEKARLFDEAALHNNTKRELKQVQQAAEGLKEENERLQAMIASFNTQIRSIEKANTQLKQSLKDSKEENGLLKTKVESEVQLLKERRESFLTTLEEINNKVRQDYVTLRKMMNLSFENGPNANSIIPSEPKLPPNFNEEEVTRLQSELENLKKEIMNLETEKKAYVHDLTELNKYANELESMLTNVSCPQCGTRINVEECYAQPMNEESLEKRQKEA